MNLLLDTHAFIWWRGDATRLSAVARDTIGNAKAIFVSMASAWEAAIKISAGRLRIGDSFAAGIALSGFQELPITFAHTERVIALPHHHRDPFDRMLIAQAQTDGLTLVTRDRRFAAYDVPVVWA